MDIKKCGKCKELLPISSFYKKKTTKSGYRSSCKLCEKEVNKSYSLNNKEKISEINNIWYVKNNLYAKKQSKIYRLSNKERRLNWIKNWINYKLLNDTNFKLKHNLRCRLRSAIKNNQKVGSAISDLGCSVDKLKIHLQLKFRRNPRNSKEIMTWDNYGEWHIDHIIPLDSFDLTNKEEFKKACHYTNLQPLWAWENLIKSNKI